jgi:hypothetical protein
VGSWQQLADFAEHQALRARVGWSHWSLDAMLVAGDDPARDPALALRAEQLRTGRNRRRLAAWVERLARESDGAGTRGVSATVPVVREEVTEARDSLLTLAYILRNAEDVRPRGVAMVERLLTDAGSVVYTDSARGAVELQVQIALDYLVGDRGATAEASVSRVRVEPARRTPHAAPPRRHPRGGLA